MFRHGALPQAPAILTQQGADIDVDYEGPLAKSQRLAEVEGIERLQAMVVSIAQVDPSVIDNINYDQAIHLSADVLGVPSKLLNSPEDVQKLRDDRAKQQAQQQQLANAGAMAQAAGKAAPALKLLPGGASGGGNASG
jgi:hypothetical protein